MLQRWTLKHSRVSWCCTIFNVSAVTVSRRICQEACEYYFLVIFLSLVVNTLSLYKLESTTEKFNPYFNSRSVIALTQLSKEELEAAQCANSELGVRRKQDGADRMGARRSGSCRGAQPGAQLCWPGGCTATSAETRPAARVSLS